MFIPQCYGTDAHIYWRIVILATGNPSAYPQLCEIEMRSSPGGADQCVGGIASSSPVYGANTPDRAFDNDTGTVWIDGATVGGYIAYQHTSPVYVRELSLYFIATIATFTWPTQVRLDWSDNGANWVAKTTVNTGFASNTTATAILAV